MTLRRLDRVAILLLLGLIHALLFLGEVRGLTVRLDHFVNAALLVTNLYFVLQGFLLARWLPRRWLGLYPVGYAALLAVFFGLNPDWRPMFFVYAVFYVSVFRLPFALGLFWIFALSHLFAQPYPLAACVTLGGVFAAIYAAHQRNRDGFRVLCLGFGLLAFLTLLFPLLCFILSDSPQTLLETSHQAEVRDALQVSLTAASLTTLIVLAFGVPLAYALARTDFPGRGVVEALIDLPILIPHSAVGVAFLFLLGSKGPLGGWVRVADTFWGIVVAQTFVSAPFLIKTALTAFAAVDPHLEQIARVLGATSAGAFGRVALPLAARGIFIGGILAWSRAISEFGSVALLAYHPMSAPVLVFQTESQAGLEQARPIAILLVLCCVWIFVGLHWIRSVAFKRFLVGMEGA